MKSKLLLSLSFTVLCMAACGRSSENVPDVDSSIQKQGALGEESGMEKVSPDSSAEIKASEEKIAALSEAIEALKKQNETTSQMTDAQRKQLEDEIAARKKELADEQAKVAAMQKAAMQTPPAIQKSAPFALTYLTDCLQLVGQSNDDNIQVTAYPCSLGVGQQFITESIGSNSFRLVNVKSNKCLSVEGASTQSGARIVQLPCKRDGSKAELFAAQDGTLPGAAKYKNQGSQLCLKTATDGLVTQGNCTNSYTIYTQKAI